MWFSLMGRVRPSRCLFSLCLFVALRGGRARPSPCSSSSSRALQRPRLRTSASKSQLQGPLTPPSPNQQPSLALHPTPYSGGWSAGGQWEEVVVPWFLYTVPLPLKC